MSGGRGVEGLTAGFPLPILPQQPLPSPTSPVAVASVIAVELPEGCRDSLTLPDVVVVCRGRAALAQLKLTNLRDCAVTVELGSTLPGQIFFQLHNENLRPGNPPRQKENFNEMFNTLGLITQLALGPLETTPLVVSFRPTGVPRSLVRTEVTADITFNVSASAELRASQRVVVPFRARVCHSVMEVDVAELDFGRVPLAASAEGSGSSSRAKDFTIRNKADVPLRARLLSGTQRGGRGVVVDFVDFELQTPLRGDLHVPPYGSVQIQARVRTTAEASVGNFLQTVVVDNLNDDRNAHLIEVHAYLTQPNQEAWLELLSPEGGSLPAAGLSFGQCYRGHSTNRALVVRNTTADVLSVQLQAPPELHSSEL
eukprot:RCo048594